MKHAFKSRYYGLFWDTAISATPTTVSVMPTGTGASVNRKITAANTSNKIPPTNRYLFKFPSRQVDMNYSSVIFHNEYKNYHY